VLDRVSFDVAPGRCLAILGRNGAGKTTLVEAILGLIPSAAGSIEFDEMQIRHLQTRQIAGIGVSLVPTGRKLFWNMTVQENLAIGAHNLRWRWRGPGADAYRSVFELFPDLAALRTRKVRTLSGGQQQMVAVGRALMSRPKLLILDEPTAGLSPQVVESMVEHLGALRAAGLSVLLLEQNVDVALEVASSVSILHRGCITQTASTDAITQTPEFVSGLFSEADSHGVP
jgi:branched-chain amino acid transport system ATP-binding protein